MARHAANAWGRLVSLSGGVVLGIGAMCSWETAEQPVVSDRPDARAVGAMLLIGSRSPDLLSRQVLEGPKDPGRSSYQIALTVCENCRRATQQGRGELIEVGPEVLAMAERDGQHIGHVHDDADAGAHVGGSTDTEARAHVGVDDEATACAHVGGPHGANVRARVDANDRADGRARERAHVGARNDESRAHVGATSRRATQSIPPKLRRAVLRRDGGKCRVPGCRHAVFTDVHHLVPRSEGGTDSLEKLATFCGAHHRAIHDGKLIVTSSASSHLEFTHADGTPYGGAVDPADADAHTKAFRALTGMGFREGDAKRALARIPHSVSSLEQVIRQALRELTSQ